MKIYNTKFNTLVLSTQGCLKEIQLLTQVYIVNSSANTEDVCNITLHFIPNKLYKTYSKVSFHCDQGSVNPFNPENFAENVF